MRHGTEPVDSESGRSGGSPPRIFSFKKLYGAYVDCRENKRGTFHAAEFELHFESELLKLERELGDRSYRPGRSICFAVSEPTLREVFAATFRDRVVHHLLYNFLEPVFEPKFIHGSYACRKGKGVHGSLRDLKKSLRKITKNNSRDAYFMHLDIRGFFMSLNKEILFSLVSKKVKNPNILWLAKLVIGSDPTLNFTVKGDKSLLGKIPPHKSLFRVPKCQGLPIGNLTSQFFANVYLDRLDQFAKHNLKINYYFRYVDDFLILSENRGQLEIWKRRVDEFLKRELLLDLHPKKQKLGLASEGIDWLGYIVKPSHILVRKRIVGNLSRKISAIDAALEACAAESGKAGCPEKDPPIETLSRVLAVINSYFGYFTHADTFGLRRRIFQNRLQKIGQFVEPNDETLSSFRIKKSVLEKAKRARK